MMQAARPAPMGVEPLLLTTVQVTTLLNGRSLTNASAFFFERGEKLFLVTSRHVLFDGRNGHAPDGIAFSLHCAGTDLGSTYATSLPLYQDGRARWRQGTDSAGEIDVAVLELDRGGLPQRSVFHAFTPAHLLASLQGAQVGASLLLLGFPLGFHDTLHYLPVARHAIIASSFGVRFQGRGQFLTDCRAHRGSSGGPVVMRCAEGAGLETWKLLGVHSSRFDMGSRDLAQDEALGLNCAWYADILLTLTAESPESPPPR